MKSSNKVKVAMSKIAREIPIIAWAVEADGIISPADVYSTRSSARWRRYELEEYGMAKRAHVRKVAVYVIPGR